MRAAAAVRVANAATHVPVASRAAVNKLCKAACTEHVHSEVKVLPGGQKSTMNNTGFEMAHVSPLHAEWLAAYDGVHPLLDIGAAYGRNTRAAALSLIARGAPTDGGPLVLAADCDVGHLAHIDSLQLPGVQTTHVRLPELEQANIPRVSGILISEVLHFLSGEAIDATLREAFDLLTPLGTLAITVCSPNINLGVDESGRCAIGDAFRQAYANNQAAGSEWPGDGLNPQQQARAAGNEWAAGGGVERLPTFFHAIDHQTLARACTRAGFQVRRAGGGWHPGYPDAYRNPAAPTENTQLVVQKPAAIV